VAKRRAKPEAAASEEGGDAPKKGGGKMKLIAAGVVALALAGGGGWYFLMGKKTPDAAMASADMKGEGKVGDAKGGPRKPAAFVDLPEMTINLAVAGQERQQFLKVKVALELSEQKVATDIQPLLPRVIDTFQVFMRELRPADLEGSAGLYRLKEEMTRRANVAVYPARVDAILFKEVLVQ
jgi:flagellar FliL protein